MNDDADARELALLTQLRALAKGEFADVGGLNTAELGSAMASSGKLALFKRGRCITAREEREDRTDCDDPTVGSVRLLLMSPCSSNNARRSDERRRTPSEELDCPGAPVVPLRELTDRLTSCFGTSAR